MFHIRVFRAIDDYDSCVKFMQGHVDILKVYGVTKVTSAKTEWFYSDKVYVVIVENEDGKAMGGIRVHVANVKEELPLELATKELDPGIANFIKPYSENGTGELCGLWNSKEVAGLGLGTKYLMRAGISLTNQLNLTSLFALCAEHTLQISLEKGFIIEKSLGVNGTFYYPKEDLIATALIIKDPETLSNANFEERKNILSLRQKPIQVKVENSIKGEFEVNYDLLIKNKSN